MAEFPTEDGAAGQWQANGIGPEGKGPLLMVSAQNDALEGQGQVRDTDRSMGSYCAESPCHWALAPSAVPWSQQLEVLGHALPLAQHTLGQDHAHPTVSSHFPKAQGAQGYAGHASPSQGPPGC